MAAVLKIILSGAFLCTLTTTMSQKPKPVTTKPVTAQKFKTPPLICKLGAYSDSASVYAEEATQLVNLSLKITDDKSNLYTVTSYRLLYKRKAVTEDEETGKVTPVTSSVSNIFSTTPLPDIWKKTLAEQIKPGEELYFFDIVAKDTKGRLAFAPDLRIKIK